MKYLPLVLGRPRRKRASTVLTMLCVVVAFGLFGMHARRSRRRSSGIIDAMSDTRLRMHEPREHHRGAAARASRADRRCPASKRSSYYNFFAGYYQDARNSDQVGAIDSRASFRTVYPDIQRRAAVHRGDERERAMARWSARISRKRRGWKIGDRIPLGSAVWTPQGRRARLGLRDRRHRIARRRAECRPASSGSTTPTSTRRATIGNGTRDDLFREDREPSARR